MLLEELPVGGLIGEAELLGHLLHAVLGGLQQHLGLGHDHLVDPLIGRLARQVAQDEREILRGDAEPIGIEGDGVLLLEMRVQQIKELLKQFLFAAQTVVGHLGAMMAKDVSQLDQQRSQGRLQRLAVVIVPFSLYLIHDPHESLGQQGLLLRLQGGDGVFANGHIVGHGASAHPFGLIAIEE